MGINILHLYISIHHLNCLQINFILSLLYFVYNFCNLKPKYFKFIVLALMKNIKIK